MRDILKNKCVILYHVYDIAVTNTCNSAVCKTDFFQSYLQTDQPVVTDYN